MDWWYYWSCSSVFSLFYQLLWFVTCEVNVFNSATLRRIFVRKDHYALWNVKKDHLPDEMSKLPWRQVPQATRVTCRHGQRRHAAEQAFRRGGNGEPNMVGPAATCRGGKLMWRGSAAVGGGRLLSTGLLQIPSTRWLRGLQWTDGADFNAPKAMRFGFSLLESCVSAPLLSFYTGCFVRSKQGSSLCDPLASYLERKTANRKYWIPSLANYFKLLEVDSSCEVNWQIQDQGTNCFHMIIGGFCSQINGDMLVLFGAILTRKLFLKDIHHQIEV